MTKEERLKGNRIIGEFVHKSFSMSCISDYKNVPDNGLPPMKYHSNYHWLIPAWQKFRNLRLEGIHEQFEHSEFKQNIAHHICYASIDEAFQSIVSAIQWYNQIKKLS
jgi:hypothetical protein